MNWESPILWIVTFSGVTFTITGWIMYRFPPKKINQYYGYRTIRSMSSQEKWDFAQTYSAKLLMVFGALQTLISVGLFCIANFDYNTELWIGSILLALTIILLFIMVESKLKKM